MDRHRGDRPGSDRVGGDAPRRMPSSRWSGGSPTNDNNHGFPRGGGGAGGLGGGGGGRFHPYRGPQDYPAGGGGGPGFRGGSGGGFGHQVPMGGPKRGFFGRGGGSPEYADGNKFAKLFVGSVPRTVTEEDVRPLFEEHGNVIEVALIRDRRSGQQQDRTAGLVNVENILFCVHMKKFADLMNLVVTDVGKSLYVANLYPKMDFALMKVVFVFVGGPTAPLSLSWLEGWSRDSFLMLYTILFRKICDFRGSCRAIAALHNQHTLPGALAPLQVRYADGDRERHEDKLFVASLNKRATEQEIAEIFTPYGHVEDVYLMRDDLKQSRGCGFVKFSNREMASAAMNALHGTYVMRGCDQPLIVRFADPKRPRPEQRGGPAFGGPGFGHRSETATIIGPTTKFDEPIGGRMPPNAWGPVSPQSHGPSSQAGAQGFGANPPAKGGGMETSSVATGILGETGGPTGGHQSNFAATSSQQGFNPSMPQIRPLFGQQMPPLQKPLMAQQHLPPSLQQLQNQQLPGSYPQGQTLQPSMQQLGQLQVPQSTGLPSSQTLPSQQIPLGLSQQGMAAIANQQQLPSSNVSQQLLQRPIQQMPSQLPQVLLQQQAQTLQSSFQQSQQAIFQLQQQMQLMQQSGLNQQQISQNAKQQQSPWSGPQPASSAPANTPAAVMPSAASAASSMPVTTTPAVPLTCNWTEHTSPEGFKYYYNNVTRESKWEKPEEYSVYEQQQQQQKLLLFQQQQQQQLAVQQLQSSAQTQSQTQIQPSQQILQTQQVQAQMQLRQQAQLQVLQPSLAYQASGMGNQQNVQDFNYSQLQAVNSVTDSARVQQGIQAAQELAWQNKPSGS